jgi:hypothetical protein
MAIGTIGSQAKQVAGVKDNIRKAKMRISALFMAGSLLYELSAARLGGRNHEFNNEVQHLG